MSRPMIASGCTRRKLLESTSGEQRLQHHDDAEDHRRRADDRRADEHGFGGGLEGVARAVAFFELVLGALEVRLETEVLLDLGR